MAAGADRCRPSRALTVSAAAAPRRRPCTRATRPQEDELKKEKAYERYEKAQAIKEKKLRDLFIARREEALLEHSQQVAKAEQYRAKVAAEAEERERKAREREAVRERKIAEREARLAREREADLERRHARHVEQREKVARCEKEWVKHDAAKKDKWVGRNMTQGERVAAKREEKAQRARERQEAKDRKLAEAQQRHEEELSQTRRKKEAEAVKLARRLEEAEIKAQKLRDAETARLAHQAAVDERKRQIALKRKADKIEERRQTMEAKVAAELEKLAAMEAKRAAMEAERARVQSELKKHREDVMHEINVWKAEQKRKQAANPVTLESDSESDDELPDNLAATLNATKLDGGKTSRASISSSLAHTTELGSRGGTPNMSVSRQPSLARVGSRQPSSTALPVHGHGRNSSAASRRASNAAGYSPPRGAGASAEYDPTLAMMETSGRSTSRLARTGRSTTGGSRPRKFTKPVQTNMYEKRDPFKPKSPSREEKMSEVMKAVDKLDLKQSKQLLALMDKEGKAEEARQTEIASCDDNVKRAELVRLSQQEQLAANERIAKLKYSHDMAIYKLMKDGDVIKTKGRRPSSPQAHDVVP